MIRHISIWIIYLIVCILRFGCINLIKSTAIRNYGGHAQPAIKMSLILSHSVTALNNNINETHVKDFLFTSCRRVYLCVCEDLQLCLVCLLINYTLATEENVRNVQVCT